MNTSCPHCHRRYSLPDGMIGKNAKCKCGKEFTVSDKRPCPYCGETIQSVAVKCRFCGEYLTAAGQKSKVDRSVYTIVGLLLGGFGIHNFMADEIYSGAGKIILSIGGIAFYSSDPAIGGFLLIACIAWVIFDLIVGP